MPTIERSPDPKPCRRKGAKFRHSHIGTKDNPREARILVRGGTKRKPWVVDIADDGSICDELVTPKPTNVPEHWRGKVEEQCSLCGGEGGYHYEREHRKKRMIK